MTPTDRYSDHHCGTCAQCGGQIPCGDTLESQNPSREAVEAALEALGYSRENIYD